MDKQKLEQIANEHIKIANDMGECQGFATAMIDIEEYFFNNKQTANEFIEICKSKGFNAEFIERTPFYMFGLNKIVIWKE